MSHLTLRLLGGFEAAVASTTMPVVFPTRKSKALLAYLAAAPGRHHSREKLASLFWDVPESRARVNLRQTLSRLRGSLKDPHHVCLLADSDSLWLDPTSVSVDVSEFETLCAEGTPDVLRRAAELYSGEFLEDFSLNERAFEEWLQLERTRLRDRAVDAMTILLNHHLDNDDTDDGISIASRLLGVDPYQEHVHRALMRLYLAQGRRQSAIKQYQTCRELLERELGIFPGGETEALYRQLQQHKMMLQPVAAPPVRTIRCDGFVANCEMNVEPASESQLSANSLETSREKRQGNVIHMRMVFSCEMSINTKSVANGLETFMMTTCGLILAAVPLALWIAWTQAIFFYVLAGGASAMLLLSVLASRKKLPEHEPCKRPEIRTIDKLNDRVLVELSDIAPFNRRMRDVAYHRIMDGRFRR